jgi:2-polyprenyl-6-methoxyphenol hydroxylase-like FAD-dependent oxidoreductase
MKDTEITIIGAGIGGLSAALALSQQGFRVRVWERSRELSEVGAGITLWSNATRVLATLGVYDALRAHAHELREGVLGTAEGQILSEMRLEDVLFGQATTGVLGIHRGKLQRVLYDAVVEKCPVVLGARCTGYRHEGDRVIATFDDHEEVGSDLLVAADGIHSAVRAQLLNDGPPRYAGYTCFRAVLPRFPRWRGASGELWGRGKRFGIVPIGDDSIYWFATHNAPQGQAEPRFALKERLLARFAGWAFQVPELLAHTDEQAVLHNDLFDRPAVRGWSDGRVVLLGDAAHPTTPNFGQGAAMAIESAVILARALAQDDDHVTAFRRYEATRFPRTRGVTDGSFRLGKIAQWQSPLACRVRHRVMRAVPAFATRRQLRGLSLYDAVTVELAALDAGDQALKR